MSEIQEDSPSTSENNVLFGKFELGRLLGYGSFAKVYHARDVRTSQSVAVKIVSRPKVEKLNMTPHVKREVAIMQRLRHPNIIRIIEVLATKTKVYIIMEYAKGGELFDKVTKGRFTENLARRYFHQLISAVGYCHSRGVFHRDLKPENLLLDENWDLKVADFGLSAVKAEITENSTSTVLYTVCGTPNYVAPEVLAKKGYFGEKIDIWSCGIILYVLTTGKLPFNDPNLMRLYRQIYRGQFRCPNTMSNELKQLLRRLLDVNPDTRITIEEMINDPWFRKGYKESNFKFYDQNWVKREGEMNEEENSRFLNAFDLISFSPGFNLSGMFKRGNMESYHETFLSTEVARRVVERMEEAAHEVESPMVVVERGARGTALRLEGQNGNFGLVVEASRLTEEFVMVEVRWRETNLGSGYAYWKEKLKPKIFDLIYQRDLV
ncbi:hypothetical protein vseg_003435 [Gypsophila vaccaria]